MTWEKYTHMITSKLFRFIIAKIYNILRYVIPHILRHMCNLHIKETEISQKRSKGIKNWKITYSVILNFLSSKTNLILGFSSPLSKQARASNYCFQEECLKSLFNKYISFYSTQIRLLRFQNNIFKRKYREHQYLNASKIPKNTVSEVKPSRKGS